MRLLVIYAYWSAKGILIGMFIKRVVRRALAVFDKQAEAKTEVVRPGEIQPAQEKTAQAVPHELQRSLIHAYAIS